MAKITFVYPDFESIGVEYLMSTCLQDGHEIFFVYYSAEDTYISTKKKAFSFQSIASKIANTQPNVVAFSCVSDNYQFQLSCAKATKQILPNVITIFGGIHPTAVPDIVLRESAVDCIAIGEAEISFSSFLKQCDFNGACVLPDKPIKGLIYKKGSDLIGSCEEGNLPDLDTLPFPHKRPFYDSLKAFSYEYGTMSSRGCPYRCSYCFNSYLFKLRGKSIIRQRSVNNVISELLWAKKEYAPKRIVFHDDSFTTNNDWILEFCKRYEKEINLPYSCITIPQYLNREKVEALSASGCVHIQIGVQSLQKEICKNILHRNSNNEKTAEVINMLRDAGIIVHVDHMLGIPDDTLGAQEKSILFYNENRPNIISVFWLTYYPQAPIIEISKQKGILSESDINSINEAATQAKRSLHSGGSMKNPSLYYGTAFLLHYLPLLPKFFVRFLVRTKLYKLFSTKSYFLSTALPRFILSIINKNDFRDRSVIVRFVYKYFTRQ